MYIVDTQLCNFGFEKPRHSTLSQRGSVWINTILVLKYDSPTPEPFIVSLESKLLFLSIWL